MAAKSSASTRPTWTWFSERTAKISRKLQEKVDEFRGHFGRDPSAYELDRMRRQSAMATRRAKTHDGHTRTEQPDRIRARRMR